MRLIIIPDDNTISVNGNSKAGFDLSELIAAGVHAVQWYGTKGEVEMRVTPDGDKPANVGISDIAQYQKFIDMHTSQPVRVTTSRRVPQRDRVISRASYQCTACTRPTA